jgi:hypothetical protein
MKHIEFLKKISKSLDPNTQFENSSNDVLEKIFLPLLQIISDIVFLMHYSYYVGIGTPHWNFVIVHLAYSL